MQARVEIEQFKQYLCKTGTFMHSGFNEIHPKK